MFSLDIEELMPVDTLAMLAIHAGHPGHAGSLGGEIGGALFFLFCIVRVNCLVVMVY